MALEQTIAFYFQDRLLLGGVETAQKVGLALVFYGVVAVFVQGVLVRKTGWPPRVLLSLGLPLGILGFVLLVYAKTFWALALGLALQGWGRGSPSPGSRRPSPWPWARGSRAWWRGSTVPPRPWEDARAHRGHGALPPGPRGALRPRGLLLLLALLFLPALFRRARL